jgi:hypothetical protein
VRFSDIGALGFWKGMERKQEYLDRWIDRKPVVEIGVIFTFLSVLYLNVGAMIGFTLLTYFKNRTGHKSDKISAISIQKIDGYIITVDNSDVKAIAAEMQKIGVNINQIARRVNSTTRIYEQDFIEIQGKVDEIWRLLRLSLSKAR